MDSAEIPLGFAPSGFSRGFLDHSGPYFLKKNRARTIVGCRIAEQHLNYVSTAHGGVLATLADVALSLAIYANDEPKKPVATVSMTTNFLSAARVGEWIEASAEIDRIGGNLAYAHGTIWCKDRLLMTMNGVFSVNRRHDIS